MPLISVIVPTHNRPDLLADALASVRRQTVTDYEVIVVSNGESADVSIFSEQVATAFGCRYFNLRHGDLPAARNFGVERARGEWIAFLDDDDIWLPEKLTRQLDAAMASGASLIACDYVAFWRDGRESIVRPRLPDGLTFTEALNLMRWWAQPSCVLLHKEAFNAAGGFDPRQHLVEDGELWRRVSWRHSICQMDEELTRYRCGHPSLMRHQRRIRYYEMRMLVKMYRDTPPDLRGTLPPVGAFIREREVVRALMPMWLRQPRKWLTAVRKATDGHGV